MPLLYGEGEKAFFRLQMEILQSSNDQSIFAWKHDLKKGLRIYSSILATSLGDFEGCHKIRCTARDILIDDGSGIPDFAQQVVGPFIKLKALSIPYDRSFTPESEACQQHPPWLTSVYQEIFTESIYIMAHLWVVFLADCSEEDRTIGIALQPRGRGFSRYHGPSRFLLPQGLDSKSHSDLKERTFYARSLMKEIPVIQDLTTIHLRHLPAEYGLWLTTPVLLSRGNRDPEIYWRNNENHQGSLGRTLHPWIEGIVPGGEGLYFSLGFRTMCGTDSKPPLHLEFWHSLGDDGFELVALFRTGALAENPQASQKPSSPDLLLGPQEFEIMRDFVVIVRARNGTNNKILLSISVENEWTGGIAQQSDLGGQGIEIA